MAATAAGGGTDDGDEWEICNDHGFVYKRRRGIYPPDREDDPATAPSSAPGPPPEAVLRRRRRQALLRLRAKYLDELSRWESLSSDLLAPLPAPPPAAPPRPPSDPAAASPPPGSSSSSSDPAVVDGILEQAVATEELLKRLSRACGEINEFCCAHEAALVDAIAELPVWGDPRELMNSLCSPDEQADTGIKLISELDEIISHFALDVLQELMAHQEQADGRAFQPSGPNRHVPFPVADIIEMEQRAAQQDEDIHTLIEVNQHLLASHLALRQGLVDTEKEMQMIRASLGDVEVVSNMQMRELLEKTRRMEAEIHAGAAVKNQVQKLHLEADKLRAEKRQLTSQVRRMTEEVKKIPKGNNLSELQAELDGLQKEHQSIQAELVYKREINTKQVEQMTQMERNLMAMMTELGKLRAKVQCADMRAQAQASAGQSGMPQAQAAAACTCPFASAYNNPSAGYQQPAQAVQYLPTAPSYQQGAHAGSYCATPYADANLMAYQLAHGNAGYPAAGYDQNAIFSNPAYTAGYDQNAIYNYPANPAGHVQNVFSNYPGYQAGYDQNAPPNNPVPYAAHQYPNSSMPVTGGAATDAVTMNSTAGQTQTSGGATTVVVVQAADPLSDGAFNPISTGGAQM